jgi:tetratricopeptide (TPR) repeat protein
LVPGCALYRDETSQSSKPPESAVEVPREVTTRSEWLRLERSLQDRLYRNPQDAAAYAALGEVYHRQRLYAAGQSAFAKAVVLDPTNTQTRYAYANLLAEAGQDGEALIQVTQAAELNPAEGDYHALRGLILRRAGRNEEAMEEFRKAWECQPPSAAAGYELALWDLSRGNVAAANRRLEVCLIYAPANDATRRLYAETLEKDGRLRDAITQWEALIAKGEGGSEAHQRLAYLYHQLGNGTRSAENLEAARRLEPRSPEIAAIAASLQESEPTKRIDPDYRPLSPPPK